MSENQENTTNKEGKKRIRRIPAPFEQIKKTKAWRLVASIVAVIAIAAISFSIGLCVSWFSLDSDMRTLIEVKKKINKEYYQEISNEQFYGTLFDAINSELLDDYSEYLSPEELKALTSDLDGNRAGLGVVLSTQSESGEKQMLITRVCGNSPAETAGITAGSYIIGFGADETNITLSKDYDEFSRFLADYEAGEKFIVRLQKNGVEQNVQISREEYVENYVFYRTNKTAYSFTTGNFSEAIESENTLACLDDDTAYIRLIQFTGNAGSAFTQAMHVFKEEGKTNLVLDLRGNGGGYLNTMQSIASYFCKTATGSRPVVAIADYGEKKERFRAPRNDYYNYFTDESRIVVLADGDSASASECLLGAMLDYGAITYADICLTENASGEAKTFGKGIMQSTYLLNLVDRDAIKLTTARILWPLSNHCIHDRGVLSTDGTKTVARDYNGDNELIAAIGKLLG